MNRLTAIIKSSRITGTIENRQVFQVELILENPTTWDLKERLNADMKNGKLVYLECKSLYRLVNSVYQSASSLVFTLATLENFPTSRDYILSDFPAGTRVKFLSYDDVPSFEKPYDDYRKTYVVTEPIPVIVEPHDEKSWSKEAFYNNEKQEYHNNNSYFIPTLPDMKQAKFEVVFDEFVSEQRKILVTKANDYANNVDRLQNFKQVASVILSNPKEVILHHLGNKVARLANLIKNNKTPNHEAIDDTIVDLANYAILLKAALVAEREAMGVGITTNTDNLVNKLMREDEPNE